MDNQIAIIKGVHPGFILARELRKRNLNQRQFAISIGEHFQTINSITKGKRGMNTALALKIEKTFNLEEGYLMVLQAYYNIEQEKRKHNTKHPDFKKLRRVLFWDTQMERIDWTKHKDYVMKRIYERGNKTEKNEINRFYGLKNKIEKISV